MPGYRDPAGMLESIDARTVKRWRDAAARHDPLEGSRQEITDKAIRELTLLLHVAIEDDSGVLPEQLADLLQTFSLLARSVELHAPDADDRLRHELHTDVDRELFDAGIGDDPYP